MRVRTKPRIPRRHALVALTLTAVSVLARIRRTSASSARHRYSTRSGHWHSFGGWISMKNTQAGCLSATVLLSLACITDESGIFAVDTRPNYYDHWWVNSVQSSVVVVISELKRIKLMTAKRIANILPQLCAHMPIYCVSAVGRRVFPVTDARIWNDLPSDVTSSPPLFTFKPRLTMHLFRYSYPEVSY